MKLLKRNFIKKIKTSYSLTTEGLPFLGAKDAKFTNQLNFEKHLHDPFPIYRILDNQGKIENNEDYKKLFNSDHLISNNEKTLNLYKQMVKINEMDNILYNAQRQGRLSFYMTNFGEEAIQIGSAAGVEFEDEVFTQYREVGVLLYRGFPLRSLMSQCLSTNDDLGKGRQMPVHYGSKEINCQTVSSPLATQIPQAAGSAYAFKISGEKKAVICYFGDGAASEGDFHAGLNFAATLRAPCLFFCRNNGYAISTHVHDQYFGDGIVSRGPGYGMKSIRVDGNDLLAVYLVTKEARRIAVENGEPVLIEAMSYRVGHHSTSDDSTRYRDKEELEYWKNERNPITRFKKYLIDERKIWSEDEEKKLRNELRNEVLEHLKVAEHENKVDVGEMFLDVYDELPPNLIEQQKESVEHVKKYEEYYHSSHH